MTPSSFEQAIAPFFWTEHSASASICLEVGHYQAAVFASRQHEGFEGNGYDWASLATVFLAEQMPELRGSVRFDPEGSLFCAYSADTDALRRFVLGFKAACADEALLRDLLTRAELD
jgi:hypothetical protein